MNQTNQSNNNQRKKGLKRPYNGDRTSHTFDDPNDDDGQLSSSYFNFKWTPETIGDMFKEKRIIFTQKELLAIETIQNEGKNLFRLFTASLCPELHGHEMVKASIVLSLIGGVSKHIDEEKDMTLRGNIHILIISDPGLGKNQLLQSAATIASKSEYVYGNTCTVNGLTVNTYRDGNGYAMDAGALLLADCGFCCIDQFDKMSVHHNALLEIMERQKFTVVRVGTVGCLPARVSIIAAAYPIRGKYNTFKSIDENVRISSSVMSRFDLIFVMIDNPDEELDSKVSEYLIPSSCAGSSINDRSSVSQSLSRQSIDDNLEMRLKYACDETEPDLIPHVLLNLYVSFARQNVNPILDENAEHELIKFHGQLLQMCENSKTRITSHHLETLYRLTEARARLELRSNATKEDARDAIDIMKYSMFDIFGGNMSDDMSFVPIVGRGSVSGSGSGTSKKSKAIKLINAMKVLQKTDKLFTRNEIKQISENFNVDCGHDLNNIIDKLRNDGYLLYKGNDTYQLRDVDL